ncbi:FecR family protein [Pseudanabaena sp. FACHB-2040]|uniref:FecR family protein n=1 Tax=Pseudanabaena sp. FACHB-2040 TaxID=2692859 RepID=UPI0018EF58E9
MGSVTFNQGQTSQAARVGTRLQAVGDTVRTGSGSSTVLAVDTGIGFVSVAENTAVRVEQLQTAPNGGKITRLRVTGGQARLQVRPFTNGDSRLEIETPAGVSGVRGTTFGVSVHPDGKTGVATLEGSVVTAAEGQSVAVNTGYQSLVIPGEPPLPPTPLTDNTQLDLRVLVAVNNQTVRVAGQVDPVNLLLIADTPQLVERNGQFDIRVPRPQNQRIKAVVITPLGAKQTYELAVP